MRHLRTTATSLVILSLSALVIACADKSTGPDISPLEGAFPVSTSDTGTKKPADPPIGLGSFHGMVRGYTSGIIDTLGTAVLLSGVTVSAYTRVSPVPGEPCPACEVGPLAASVQTNGDGVFQMPTLAAGNYVVVFTPPSASAYAGGWTVATAGPTSNQSPWWIMLPKK